MTKTKFVLSKGTKEHPVIKHGTELLKENESDPKGIITPEASRLEDLCERTVMYLENSIAANQRSLEEIDEKIKLSDNSEDHVKEIFWGKDWRHYVNKLKNRKRQYSRAISSCNKTINIIKENLHTDDIDIACDLIEFYFKIVERIEESDIKKMAVGDMIMYKFPDIVLDKRMASNSIEGRHAILQHYDPEME